MNQQELHCLGLVPALNQHGAFSEITMNRDAAGSVISAQYRGQPFVLRLDGRGITLFGAAEIRDDAALVAWAYIKWQAITTGRWAIIVQEIEHALCTHVLHIPGPGRPNVIRVQQPSLLTGVSP